MLRRVICSRAAAYIKSRPVISRCFFASSRGNAQAHTYIQDGARNASERTRNIGIIAHIDAGKTTTTERMLYYSGFTRRIGDVDEGSTVTDFLPAERARGITVQSAAITFLWPPATGTTGGQAAFLRSSVPHNINLIDTPGHADFTFEVLRSLRVLDGTVCILDGVAGVEAQTEKVWSQASAYAIPRLIYVNKLDRDGASFARTVKEIGARLHVWPAVCGIPWWDARGKLQGVGDVVNHRALRYTNGSDGKDIQIFPRDRIEEEDSNFADHLQNARVALIELLSEYDDAMVEHYLEAAEDHHAIRPEAIINSLRRCTLEPTQRVVPVYAGASFRNMGVQPLLDAAVDLLPSPDERPDPEVSLGGNTKAKLQEFLSGKLISNLETNKQRSSLSKDKLIFSLQKLEACALAFKVVADPKRGVLVYVRVYSGSLHRNARLWNTNLHVSERAPKLLKMYADDAVDVDSIPAGQIGVIPGLKAARTGDTLISYPAANPKTGPPTPINNLQLRPIDVPPPVFFVGIEPNSLSEEKNIKESLDLLLREDPSLHVSIDEESGQTHLSGMGELHLDIARDRLVQDLKAKARIGNIEIGYREMITSASQNIDNTFERDIGGKSVKAACMASVAPVEEFEKSKTTEDAHIFNLHDDNQLIVSIPTQSPDAGSEDLKQHILPDHLSIEVVLQAIQNGVSAALARGPMFNYPLHAINIHVTFDPTQHVFPNTTSAAISSATRNAVQRALRQSAEASEPVMKEPVMLVTISVDEASMGAVVHDLSSARGGSVVSLGSDQTAEADNIIDISKIYTPPDPFAGEDSRSSLGASSGPAMRQIVARVPLKEMLGYLRHLRSLTAGRGTFTMVVDRFERMSAVRQRAVVNALA